ncbi:MAG: hypothetical protein HQL37_09620 [Alphaproteobacteria bacterium]|nr:hypothetical protein [Alphaproteobacteria bacterium]
MVEFGFELAALILCFFLGFPISRLLSASSVRGRALIAPVLGYGLFGVVVTILYRFGVMPRDGGFLVLIPALISALSWLAIYRPAQPEQWRKPLRFCLLVLAVVLACLTPEWIGGPQFWAFQGNHWDNINYIAYSSATRTHSFAELTALTPESPAALQNDYLLFAKSQLDARPTVGIALAALAGMFQITTPEASYPYLMLLQVMMLFAASFVLLNTFRAQVGALAVSAAALTLGFFMQYVVDINAWSQLAAMPLALTVVMIVVLTLAPEMPPLLQIGVVHSIRRTLGNLLIITILVGSLLYIYPEILLAYGPPGVVSVGVVLLVSRFSIAILGRLLVMVLGAGLAVAACLPFWQGSVGHLLRQMQMASSQPVTWWKYFQRYLFGRDVDYQALVHNHDWSLSTLYGLFSLPVDFLSGALGAFWLQPGADISIRYRLFLKLALYAFLVWLFLAAARTVWANWRRDPQSVASQLSIFAVAACMLPIVFVVLGHYWVGGKTLAMATPLLFIVLAAPLLDPEARLRWRMASALFVAVHLGFGLYRPFAASEPSGIHYPFPPYPSVQDSRLKTELSWDIARWRPMLQTCRHTSIDLDNPFLERYAQVYLTELQVDWTTTRPLNSYYGLGESLGRQPQPGRPDCLLTAQFDHVHAGQSVIWLGRNRQP